jgi:anthranilate 1,2-dioxygenase small subunit
VVNTSQDGASAVYQAGRYLDLVVRTPEGLRFKQKRCVYDTLRVQTLLAYPI